MSKQLRSLDGFVLRRHDDQPTTTFASHNGQPEGLRPIASTPSRSINSDNIEDDIESSLDGLNLVDDHKLAEVTSDETSFSQSRPTKLSRKERKLAKKTLAKQKKHYRLKKFAKRLAIAVPILLVLVIGFFLVKALLAGSKVFKGNIFSALTTKTKLKEDSNGWTNILIFSSSSYNMSDSSSYDGVNLTDSIMVLSINQSTDQAIEMSVPRDLWVNYSNSCSLLGTTAGKINTVYECGSNNGKDVNAGASALESSVGSVLGISIQYYVHPDWTALQQIVDAVGGVDVTINSGDSTCVGGNGVWDIATGVKYTAGVHHLNGQQALALARARGDVGGCGLSGSNFARENAQRSILAALQKKVVSTGTLLNLVAVNSLLDAVGSHLVTSFQSSDFQTLIDLTKKVKSQNVTSLAFNSRPNNLPDLFTTGYVGSASVVLPMTYETSHETDDYSQIQTYVAQHMSNDPVVKEAATVDVLNGSGVSGAAKTVAKELETKKFTVGTTANAPANIADKVEIYDLSSGKMPKTSAALAKLYGVKVQTGALSGYSTSDDASFVVVVGPSLANSVTSTDSSSSN